MRPFVVLIFPGPMYRLDEALGKRLQGLSDDFDGLALTSSPERKEQQFGSFKAVCVSSRCNKLVLMWRYFREIRKAAVSRKPQGGISLIATYDPLRSGLIGWICSILFSSKLVIEVNGDYWNLANYSEVKIEAVKKLKRSAYVAVEKFLLRKADGIKLLYSDQLLPLFTQLPRANIVAFPNMIRTDKFKNLGTSHEILTVGFPLHVKGIDILISAFKKVSALYPDWHLKIIGWYPNRGEIDGLIDSHPRIVVSDPVHPTEMPGQIGRCEIFVLASRTESMGRVLVESMAAGKARIGTRVGGIPSVIEDGVDGLLVPPEDVDVLADALSRLIESEGLRRKLGSRGAERAASFFSPQRYFENTKNLYDGVLDK